MNTIDSSVSERAVVENGCAKTDHKDRHQKISALSGHIKQENTVKTPPVDRYLEEGKLADAEAFLSEQLSARPTDDEARFSLGMVQFLLAFQGLTQDLYHFGVRSLSTNDISRGFVRLPIPKNPKPETLTYEKARLMADRFQRNLATCEATLAQTVAVDIKLPLKFGMIRLDLNGDGKAEDSEMLWQVYANLTNDRRASDEGAQHFLICFDRGDVHWLRGYCHLLMSVCDIYLAHDSRDCFEHTAHLLFSKVQSPYDFLSNGKHVRTIGRDDLEILDLVALIHLINWQVVEPEGMKSALYHLQAVVAQSKESWHWILTETDDDHEWLPSPTQTGVIPHVRVTQDMVTSWSTMMEEADKLLKGEVLIPFWRSNDGRGVNLRRVFLEPRQLDLVLWVQGSAAAPYLEKGQLTDSQMWLRLPEAFGNHFPCFALYFN